MKQSGTVRVGSIVVDEVLPQATSVTEKSGFVLPLLVVNLWKYDYQSQLGQSQLTNDYKAFIRESFVEELKRSGKYNYVEDQSEMEIDLKIKTISMTAPMRKTGNVVWIAPQAELAGYERAQAEARVANEALAPLVTEYIQINYANAQDIANLLTEDSKVNTEGQGGAAQVPGSDVRGFLSQRGSVTHGLDGACGAGQGQAFGLGIHGFTTKLIAACA